MLIGFTGVAGSGKDAACAALVDEGFTHLAFADPLREMAEAINPIVGRRIDGCDVYYLDALRQYGYAKAKELFPEVRRFLQRLGTDAGRNILGQNVWVDASMARADDHGDFCWSDVRFLNEEAAIRARGGFIVRIDRPGAGLDGEAAEHASERELEQITPDHIIHNTGTLNEFRREVLDVLAFFEHTQKVGIY